MAGTFSKEKCLEHLQRWVFRQNKRGRIILISLKHRDSVGSSYKPVERWEFDDPNDRIICDDLVNAIGNAANSDAESMGGVQLYSLEVYFEKDPPNEYSFRYAFDIFNPSLEETHEPIDSPTPKGIIQSQMRHTENMHRLAYSTIETTNSKLRVELDEARARIAKQDKTIQELHEQNMRNFILYQDLMDRKQDRDLDRQERLSKMKVRADLVEKATLFLPIIFSRINGTPSAVDPNMMGLKMFLETIKPEQFHAIMGNLDQTQQAFLVNLIQMMAPAEKKINGSAENKQLE